FMIRSIYLLTIKILYVQKWKQITHLKICYLRFCTLLLANCSTYIMAMLQFLNNVRFISCCNNYFLTSLFYCFNSILDFRYHTTIRSEEHTSELQSRFDIVCRILLEK